MSRHVDPELTTGALRLAVAHWQGRVSPVFDVAEQILLMDVEPEGTRDRGMWRLESVTLHERVRRLTDLKVNVLVCGAISWPLEALLTAGAIRVIPFICGDVEEVVKAFRDGTLETERFAMPGCCRKRRLARRASSTVPNKSIHEEKS